MTETTPTKRRPRFSTMIVMATLAALVWIILSGDVSIQNLILGFLFGLVVNFVIRQNTNLPTSDEELNISKLPSQIAAFLVYIIKLEYDILRSGIDVAQRVLSPSMSIDPGIYVIRVHDPAERSLVEGITAHGISITPGSLVIDFDEARDIVIVHVLDRKKWTVESLDAEQLDRVRLIHRMLGDREPDKVAYDPAEYL
ncbi:MAG: Na+/H+ antiporter subunit E [Anaerolineae bacterium]|nr:Na+/H+ antiporter subunit E [Anaerolineae bacterium]MCA9887956.1 Na+/H+ antiporter subunit E [Anaerolineae bacterium]MCA9892879.1 Na+/H+ antiporter subunit E [Anaerolineae bacterium]MCB9461855.1 Na+/H+ antiporter subunit E [Anaerolineaceae bacterium]